MEMVSNSADQRSGLLNVLKFILELKELFVGGFTEILALQNLL
jgi:hypothetical protein